MAYAPITDAGGVVTSFVGLTTTFTVPSSCSNIFRAEGPSIVAFDPGYGIDTDPSVICQPRAVTTWWNQANLGTGQVDHTAVSLGPLTCPQGFATVATYAVDSSSTQIMCCPNSYSLANYNGGSVSGNCRSSLRQGQSVTVAYTPVAATTPWSTSISTVSRASYAGAIAVVGWNIQQQQPIAVASTTTSTSTSSTMSTAVSTESSAITGFASSTATASGTAEGLSASTLGSSAVLFSATNASPASNDLSTGAKAGIGVGVAMGSILLVLLALLVWVLARKNRSRATETTTSQMPFAEKTEVAPAQHWNHYTPYTDAQVNELDGQAKHGELQGFRSPAELDTGTWSTK